MPIPSGGVGITSVPLPVTVADFEEHLNATVGSLPQAEAERTIAAATIAVEGRVGPIVARGFTQRLIGRNGVLAVSKFPLVSVEALADQDGAAYDVDLLDVNPAGLIGSRAYRFSCGPYDVEYTAGRVTPGENLELAVIITAAHLWETQRGRQARARTLSDFEDAAGRQDVALMLRGFALPRRALELLQPDDDLGVA